MAAESGKIDPMHQFMIHPMFGTEQWSIAGYNIAFTNSALWMLVTFAAVWLFMLGGMKRQLVPGRWQVAVEGFTGFITNMMDANIGPKGRAFTPWVFSLFMFILFANMLGMTESFGPYSSEPFDYRLPESKANASGRATTGSLVKCRLMSIASPLAVS